MKFILFIYFFVVCCGCVLDTYGIGDNETDASVDNISDDEQSPSTQNHYYINDCRPYYKEIKFNGVTYTITVPVDCNTTEKLDKPYTSHSNHFDPNINEYYDYQ